eukprot:GHVS01028047.1.p1 GENE.GHVS01028047.1~~GHVS01028047.1.p1  ORF type:complete len:1104 (+),score=122.07 GHVS01028047.1:629-3940(+)
MLGNVCGQERETTIHVLETILQPMTHLFVELNKTRVEVDVLRAQRDAARQERDADRQERDAELVESFIEFMATAGGESSRSPQKSTKELLAALKETYKAKSMATAGGESSRSQKSMKALLGALEETYKAKIAQAIKEARVAEATIKGLQTRVETATAEFKWYIGQMRVVDTLFERKEEQIADLDKTVKNMAANNGYHIGTIAAFNIQKVGKTSRMLLECQKENADRKKENEDLKKILQQHLETPVDVTEVSGKDKTWVKDVVRSQSRRIDNLEAMLLVADLERRHLIKRTDDWAEISQAQRRLDMTGMALLTLYPNFNEEVQRIERFHFLDGKYRESLSGTHEVLLNTFWRFIGSHSSVVDLDTKLKVVEDSIDELASTIDQGVKNGQTCSTEVMGRKEVKSADFLRRTELFITSTELELLKLKKELKELDATQSNKELELASLRKKYEKSLEAYRRLLKKSLATANLEDKHAKLTQTDTRPLEHDEPAQHNKAVQLESENADLVKRLEQSASALDKEKAKFSEADALHEKNIRKERRVVTDLETSKEVSKVKNEKEIKELKQKLDALKRDNEQKTIALDREKAKFVAADVQHKKKMAALKTRNAESNVKNEQKIKLLNKEMGALTHGNNDKAAKQEKWMKGLKGQLEKLNAKEKSAQTSDGKTQNSGQPTSQPSTEQLIDQMVKEALKEQERRQAEQTHVQKNQLATGRQANTNLQPADKCTMTDPLTEQSSESSLQQPGNPTYVVERELSTVKRWISKVDELAKTLKGRILLQGFERVLMFARLAHDDLNSLSTYSEMGLHLTNGIRGWLQRNVDRRGYKIIDCRIVGSFATDLFVDGVSDFDFACDTTLPTEASHQLQLLTGDRMGDILGDLKGKTWTVAHGRTHASGTKSIITQKLDITLDKVKASIDVVLFNSEAKKYNGFLQTELVTNILAAPKYASIKRVAPVLKSISHFVRHSFVESSSLASKSMSSFGLVLLLQSVIDRITTSEDKPVSSQTLLQSVVKLIGTLGTETTETRIEVYFEGGHTTPLWRYLPLTDDQDVGLTVLDPIDVDNRISLSTVEEGFLNVEGAGTHTYCNAAEFRKHVFKFYQAILKLIDE